MELLAGISLAAIEQWGKTISGNNVKTKFPIAFTAFCMLSVSVNSSNGNAAESVFRNGFGYTNKTLSDWILRGPTGDATYFADYIAIGCQPQWGFEETETKTIAFPISFESIKYVFLSKIYGPASGGADTVAYNFFRKSLTGVSFDYAYTRNWLAIGGKQPQWGYSNSTGVTFPIAFRECYAVVSNAHSNTTGNTDHYHLLSWTATGAAFGYWNMSFYGTLYIALGVE